MNLPEAAKLGVESTWRYTSQFLAPIFHEPSPRGQYDIYPAFPIAPGSILVGFEALASYVAQHRVLRIDGYIGVFWEVQHDRVNTALASHGIHATWADVSRAMRSEAEIEDLFQPFLGNDDPLFGTRFTGTLADFFDEKLLRASNKTGVCNAGKLV